MIFYFTLILLKYLFFPFNFLFANYTDNNYKIIVSIPVQAYFINRIIGNNSQIKVLYKDHNNLHEFDSNPRYFIGLKKYDSFFVINRNQFPFEKFYIHSFKKNHKKMDIIYWFNDQEKSFNPHVWISFNHIKKMIKQVVQYASERNPGLKDLYKENSSKIFNEISLLDEDIKIKIKNKKNRKFLAYHSSLAYYAKRYNLDPFFIEDMNKEVSARKVHKLMNLIEKKVYTFIIVDKNYYNHKVVQLLKKSKKIKVILWNPMEKDWFKMIRNITNIFINNLK